MARRLWVLDLDGTLMDTTFLYGYSYLDAARLMLEEFGGSAPHVTVLVNRIKAANDTLVDATNPATGKPFSYDRQRFPTALQNVYLELCEQLGRPQMGSALDRLWAIGEQVFDASRYPGVIKSEAVPLIRQLKRAGDYVAILTKGDPYVQSKKIDALRVALAAGSTAYDEASIVERDKGEEFALLLKSSGCQPDKAFSVGDTYDADIAPALDLGYRGIWLAAEGWQQVGKMAELRARAIREGVTVINHLREVFPLTA
jgi:FMN phosphatase YigB (HAD superfamily)